MLITEIGLCLCLSAGLAAAFVGHLVVDRAIDMYDLGQVGRAVVTGIFGAALFWGGAAAATFGLCVFFGLKLAERVGQL